MANNNNENSERRMIPYGINLNEILADDSKAIIPVFDARPLAAIPPSKINNFKQAFFARSVLPAPPQPLLLEDAPPTGPIVKLLGVKRDRKGDIVCAKYTTGDRPYFEGVRAHPSKVKFILPKEAPKRALAAADAPKRRKTVADLEKELKLLHDVIKLVEHNHHVLGRTVISTSKRVDFVESESKRLDNELENVHRRMN
jgi:hypothetical protein